MKLFTVFGISLLLLSPTVATAQYVESTGAAEEHSISAFLEDAIIPILAYATESEQKIASRIKFVVVPFHPADFVISPLAVKTSKGERIIILSDAFLLFLDGYLEAYLISEETGEEFLAERWAQRHFAQVSMLNQNPMQLPGQMFGLNDTEINEFRERTSDAFVGLKWMVLADILLHEIGHHAAELFYDPEVDTPEDMIAAETAADAWATELFAAFSRNQARVLDKSNSTGRAFALLAFRELTSFVSVADVRSSRTHPTPVSRVLAVLDDGACSQVQSTLNMEELCKKLEEVASSLEFDDRGYAAYLERARSGEAFAMYRLGQVLLGMGKSVEACSYFQDAHEAGLVGWNTRFLAWCFEPESPTGLSDPDFAEELYYLAAEDGWVEAQAWVRNFGTR